LAGFVTGLDFVDNVDPTFAAHDLAGGMTLFGGLDGRDDFHGKIKTTPPRFFSVNGIV
jgi:hypothetical protein